LPYQLQLPKAIFIRGFTAIEMLVTIAMLAVLTAFTKLQLYLINGAYIK
jgi:prepilin-type N-terminal cleavage/methylation domain-containing protein